MAPVPPYTEQQRKQIDGALVRAAPVLLGYAFKRVRKGRESVEKERERKRIEDRARELVQQATCDVLARDRVFDWEGEIDEDRFQLFMCLAIKSLDDRRPGKKRPHHEFDDETDAPVASKTSEDLLARKRALERLRAEVKDDRPLAALLEIVLERDCSTEEKARLLGTDVAGVYELNRKLDRAAKRVGAEMSS